jgi:hypothetical protein
MPVFHMTSKKTTDDCDIYAERNLSLVKAVQIASMYIEKGCRVIEEGNNTVIVYDCNRWDKENTALLLFLKPNAEVSIHSSINSLSGFKIIISEPKIKYYFLRFNLAILSFVVFFTMFFCCSYDYLLPTINALFNSNKTNTKDEI